MIGYYAAGNAHLVVSGDSDEQQGSILLVLLLLGVVAFVVVTLLARFQQPFVVVLEHPFRFIGKVIKFGIMSTVLAVAIISILIGASSPS